MMNTSRYYPCHVIALAPVRFQEICLFGLSKQQNQDIVFCFLNGDDERVGMILGSVGDRNAPRMKGCSEKRTAP